MQTLTDTFDDVRQDVVFENNNITSYPFVFNFTMPAGATKSFDLTIIDDNIAEYYYERIIINLGMYESDEMVTCYIDIEDNDGNLFHSS